MSEPDDLQWLEALSGKGRAPAQGSTEREAHMMREAILEHSKAEPPPVLADERTRQAELLERARREGLLEPRLSTGSSRRTRPSSAVLRMCLAAGFVGVAVLAAWQWLPNRQPEVVRGHDETFQLQAQDPRQLKQQILLDLKDAGVTATGYTSLGAEGIDADLPEPVPAQIQSVLRKYTIPIPTDGTLRVEIRAQQPK